MTYSSAGEKIANQEHFNWQGYHSDSFPVKLKVHHYKTSLTKYQQDFLKLKRNDTNIKKTYKSKYLTGKCKSILKAVSGLITYEASKKVKRQMEKN